MPFSQRAISISYPEKSITTKFIAPSTEFANVHKKGVSIGLYFLLPLLIFSSKFLQNHFFSSSTNLMDHCCFTKPNWLVVEARHVSLLSRVEMTLMDGGAEKLQ